MAKRQTSRCWIQLGSVVDVAAGGTRRNEVYEECGEPVTVIMHNKNALANRTFSYVCERHAVAWEKWQGDVSGWRRLNTYVIEEIGIP